MYSGRDLARDTYTGIKLRPVKARPVMQPFAAVDVKPLYSWSDGQARVSSLVGTLPRGFDSHTHIFDMGACITCNKREG